MSASCTKSTIHLCISDITLPPCIWIDLAQSNIHCYHARIMAWDWKGRIKWCSGHAAPAKWERLPYFCPGLQLSCRLGVDHLMSTVLPAVPCTPVLDAGCSCLKKAQAIHTDCVGKLQQLLFSSCYIRDPKNANIAVVTSPQFRATHDVTALLNLFC